MPKTLWEEQVEKYGACCANCKSRDHCENFTRQPHDNWVCALWDLAEGRAVQLTLFDL